jgi:hypothetical protein
MWREKTISDVLEIGSGTTTSVVSTDKGRGGETTLLRIPACATAHIEHSWLGIFESAVWTCVTWTAPTTATSKTHNHARILTLRSTRDMCPALLNRSVPQKNSPRLPHI